MFRAGWRATAAGPRSQIAGAIIPTLISLARYTHASSANTLPSNSQFAAPYLAHTDLVAHAVDVRLDVSSELDLAGTDGAALAGEPDQPSQ
jgi:hypothetical protein